MPRKTKTKVCTNCNRRLPLKDFHKDRTAKDGRRTQCSACRQAIRHGRKPPKKRSIPIKQHPVQGKKSDKEIESEAIRNALLILRNRHPEEYTKILNGQRWHLAVKYRNETSWREVSQVS